MTGSGGVVERRLNKTPVTTGDFGLDFPQIMSVQDLMAEIHALDEESLAFERKLAECRDGISRLQAKQAVRANSIFHPHTGSV